MKRRAYNMQRAMDRRASRRADDNARGELVWKAEAKRLAAEEAAKAAGDASTKDQADSKCEQAAEKGGAA